MQRKGKIMKIFESEIYAKNGRGCLPFKIVVEETFVQGKRKVEVRKIEYNTVGEKMLENESLMFATAWTEEQIPVMSLGTEDGRGSSLMFDFGTPFLDIMKKGGKTVLEMYNEENDELVNESWLFKDDKFVCESKELSYSLKEFVDYMDKEECNNIDVFLNGELKINICNIDCFI